MLKINYLFIFIGTWGILEAHDNAHFYRAPYVPFEPRFERPGLMSLDVYFGGGGTKKARNSSGQLVALLDLYGSHNMQALGLTLPHDNGPFVNVLRDLAALPAREQFGFLSIEGTFDFLETTISLIHNFKYGFFVQAHLPVRHIEIDTINYRDLSPQDAIFPNYNTPAWQEFLKNFDAILNHYHLKNNQFHHTGPGDLSLLVGWSHNYQETIDLDFIDIAVQGGILVPTGTRRNQNELFSIALGYNGHWGLPFNLALAIGSYEWLTLGGFLEALFFIPTSATIRMNTHPCQQGLITLNRGNATINKGSIWHTGGYIKADHFSRGLSLLVGYSYALERETHITPYDHTLFNRATVNSAQIFKGFSMHTLHIGAEYDFTQQNWRFGPRIGITYNQPLAGIRTFNAQSTAGIWGLDILWDY